MKKLVLAPIAIVLLFASSWAWAGWPYSGNSGGGNSHNQSGATDWQFGAVSVGGALSFKTPISLNSGTALTFDPMTSYVQPIAMTGNCTLTLNQSNIPTGYGKYIVFRVTQNTGSHYSLAVNQSAGVGAKWASGVAATLTQEDAAVDWITCFCDGTTATCSASILNAR